jgi:hypothetical protein
VSATAAALLPLWRTVVAGRLGPLALSTAGGAFPLDAGAETERWVRDGPIAAILAFVALPAWSVCACRLSFRPPLTAMPVCVSLPVCVCVCVCRHT